MLPWFQSKLQGAVCELCLLPEMGACSFLLCPWSIQAAPRRGVYGS